ncbi:FHF complex subunit HOOK-interacting protein 1A [Pteronotus mesoamericanus]|uniref:FHF complex subunit HOOK-interacting protein 1A n=1 Tax=Pteronotus mesoamericanus TaxID=1884717 RepID=UPI0023ED5922|nr:FHF complex subunit HOOK interacting protein 1A [Pteronotus parnellii mesoamericanus]XP_054418506.1 FHF complex subunit HOOK interacting protein 1A [Pteronotus parnellii mesoamericanus]XP_054418508.1 FHF complex subunit HOOK interacting protein 1A [Pteronotus parnellii mesoamericanus]XP_054418513.1 FHF complex subunit HOOK interacting protein 1A [Pteronotus parnellii mesoamericanus]XP_054418519.1 FHF complex subunit HOOK interacting protein 1A [Pteronotus parnellii mesoamericanus]XP_0544185
MMSSVATESKLQQAVSLQGVDPETCMIVFKNHWAQVVKILEKHDPLKNSQAKYGSIPPDEASAVQNYVEHMLFLLIEEQAKDAAMGPILEFVVSENIMEKLFLWSLRREFTDDTKIEQLKMYEMLVTQSHQPLLHHKPILKPLMMLLSSCSGTATPVVEEKLVVLLNQLCCILAKDPSILELFFHTSEDQGAANFLIFSLLIPFIHREGTVGQQARDALLFIMSLSAENSMVAHHIVENTYFCPVLATGLSGLYSSLPTKLEEKGEEWHCLLRDDWLLLPSLVQFMNSLEFCNAVIQVAHPLIRNQLVSYIYNGFLVPVLAPALHKVTVEEVMTTTAYLDLFLRSISEPALLQIFLRFILLHQHENVHILDTLTSRINTPFRLCVVSLALFRTLIGLHCEDVMLQLVLRYLIPCNHMMLSQRWAVKERDCYSVSAAKLLALTPVCCSSGITLTLGNQERDYILWSKCTHDGAGPLEQPRPEASPPAACIVERGRALDISYLQYLWEARANILQCMRDCRAWSALYDGDSPDPETFLQSPTEESAPSSTCPAFRPPPPPLGKTGPPPATRKDKNQTDLEWDDSYDTGISSGADAGSPGPYDDLENAGPPMPMDPPKHIQEMKKNAILRFKGTYIEESDFQDDVMVYRLCAEKDSEDARSSQEEPARPTAQDPAEGQSDPVNNGLLPSPQPETDSEGDRNRDNSDMFPNVSKEPQGEPEPAVAPESHAESAPCVSEAEHNSDLVDIDPEGEDFIAQYDQIIKELDSGTEGLMGQNFSAPDPSLLTNEPEGKEDSRGEGEEEAAAKKDLEEEEDDFDSFIAEAPAVEAVPYPFGVREEADFASHRPVRTQSIPFTGPFISVVLSKLENMLENSLHVNLLLIGIITQLASYPQPLLRSFLLNTNMVFQPSVRSLYQVLASVKNKIEQFASVERDFPGLLIQAQKYLLFRVDMSDVTLESLTKDSTQDASRTGTGKSLLDGPPRVLQPFLTNRAKAAGVPPSLPLPVRNTMLAAALFPEFLKELAALAQEHSILCYQVLGDFEDSYC